MDSNKPESNKEKAIKAFRAMSDLGIPESKVKPVLKKLLKLYDKNWSLIEEENYRALADAIFDDEDNKEPELDDNNKNKKVDGRVVVDEEAHVHEEPLRPLKRLRLRGQEVQSSRPLSCSSPSSFPLKRPKIEGGAVPESGSRLQSQSAAASSDGNKRIEAHQVPPRDALVNKGKRPVSAQVSPRGRGFISDRTPPAEPLKKDTIVPGASLQSKNKMPHPFTLIKPKDEPVDDIPDYETPIAMILPEPSSGRDSPMNNGAEKHDDHDPVAAQCRDEDLPSINGEANVDVALSSMGEEKNVRTTQTVNASKVSEANGSLIIGGKKDSVMPSCIANGSDSINSSSGMDACYITSSLPCQRGPDDAALVSKKVEVNDFLESGGGRDLRDTRALHDVEDITKGEERVKISWVNDITNDFPPPFHYIPRNLVFRDAYVNISLSCIGNKDCCSACMGNCILSSRACTCTTKTGGEFAYTAQGLLKEEFLEECIAISRNPQNLFYCKNCPLERSKNDDCLEPCKGHLRRKFIKECWSKCGCGKHCGNRIVQRGITCNLQVYLTSDGKGWGLRTLEDLPKGAFVCEFVGEILTVKELHERNLKYPKKGKYTYPILLDGDWDSGVVKDGEALCLYAALYGNVARFINHRCLDANLIEIAVEVEGPTHKYYHFAFFTSRKIAAQEELTWDYGINFDDYDQPAELFRCRCGSKFCRNIKRSNRSTRSLVA